MYPLQNAESWRSKTRWQDFHICLFFLTFSSLFHHECDTCDSKKATLRLGNARATRVRVRTAHHFAFALLLLLLRCSILLITNTELCYIRIAKTKRYVEKTSLFRDFFPLWGNIFPYTYRDSIQISVPPFYILLSRRKPLQYTIPYATKLIALLSTQAASAEPPSPNEGDR